MAKTRLPKWTKNHPQMQEALDNPEEALEFLPMSFQSPESKNVAESSYDPSTQLLTVTFKTGKSYGYAPFPIEKWREFLEAESKGRHFAEFIRPFFTGRAL